MLKQFNSYTIDIAINGPLIFSSTVVDISSNGDEPMTLEMAWRTRPLQLVLSGGPDTPTPTIEYKQRVLTPGHQG